MTDPMGMLGQAGQTITSRAFEGQVDHVIFDHFYIMFEDQPEKALENFCYVPKRSSIYLLSP